jgi:hypothetical protein
VIAAFVADIEPIGFWPGRSRRKGGREIAMRALRWAAVVTGTIALLVGTHRMLLLGEMAVGIAWLCAGGLALAWGATDVSGRDSA